MPRLKVMLRGAQISDVGLNPDKEYIGGRKENCDIRLQPEKGISREHFKIKFEEGRWVLSSLSRFGEIYSQGQRVESTQLEHGVAFQIPPYEFSFSDVPDSSIENADNQNQKVDENERTVIGATQQMPYIKMLSTAGDVREMLRLEVGDTWVAGRDPSCQIVIPDQRVSRRQFEIRKINGIFTLVDLASVNGTFLNGSPISSADPSPLKSGDAISVLDNVMYFELHDPNFQYRMDRIEIPPLQILSSEEALPSEATTIEAAPEEEPMMLQEIEQPYVDEQQQVTFDPANQGGPFTGMPGAEPTPNQFYSFQPPPQQAPPETVFQKLKSSKPLLIAVILIVLSVAFYLSEQMGSKESATNQAANTETNAADPFSRLKPEEQKTIKDLYSLAQKSMLQQKYAFALENLDKIHQILPTGYLDSLSMRDEALANEKVNLAMIEQEKLEKEKEARAKTISETVEKCKKLIGPNVIMDTVKECMSPVVLIDPTNNDYIKLLEQAQKIIDDKNFKEQQEQNYLAQVKSLKEIFLIAEKIQSEGFPYKAIKAYNKVIASDLPDPENLKNKSKSRIKFIEDKIASKTAENLKQADAFIQEGKLKEAVLSLRSSLVYDPDNKTIKERIDKYSEDLRRKVMVIYQESIIDENFGNIDGDEARSGAKEKWKKIVETDLDDGEYYRKAYVKLKKYGVL